MFLLLFFSGFCLLFGEENLRVAAVQFEVQEEIYRSKQVFYKTMDTLLREITHTYTPDIVVFPEYTNVFLSLISYYPIISVSDTFQEAFRKIQRINPGLGHPGDVFIEQSDTVRDMMDNIWGSLARKYNIFICPGSAFIADADENNIPALFNRLFLYNNKGQKVYQQNKVFLTPFEEDLLHLSPGAAADARPTAVNGRDIVFTLCRDTFFSLWENRFPSADLWFDCKANGAEYDADQKENFLQALPERITSGNVPIGCTVCLTGRFLDLLWEGESSVILKSGESYTTAEKSATFKKQEVLYFTVSGTSNIDTSKPSESLPLLGLRGSIRKRPLFTN